MTASDRPLPLRILIIDDCPEDRELYRRLLRDDPVQGYESELRYRRLFETAKDGIFILDADSGEITDVNPFLAELLGYTRGELVGRRSWEVSPLNDIAAK
jgi:PAS domain-containing protein